MIESKIIAPLSNNEYKVPINIGNIVFSIKLDIGAGYTVVSIDAYAKDLTDINKETIINYCESNCRGKRQFQSASGDYFWGYPIVANNVIIDETMIPTFGYYLVVENKRSISLLGVDFLDNCRYTHDPHDSIIITEFDDSSYNSSFDHPINNSDLVAIIDSILL